MRIYVNKIDIECPEQAENYQLGHDCRI